MGLLAFRVNSRPVAAFVCGLALACGASAQDPDLVVVTSVIDGDTIKVQVAEGSVTIRLRHIDAPELNQPGGGAATRALHKRLLAQEVFLHDVTRESDEHWIAVVHLGDENINGWMVKQGHAWAHRGHTRDPDYCAWEHAARAQARAGGRQVLDLPLGLAHFAARQPVLRVGLQQRDDRELHARNRCGSVFDD